jgi:hypothetical protein
MLSLLLGHEASMLAPFVKATRRKATKKKSCKQKNKDKKEILVC